MYLCTSGVRSRQSLAWVKVTSNTANLMIVTMISVECDSLVILVHYLQTNKDGGWTGCVGAVQHWTEVSASAAFALALPCMQDSAHRCKQEHRNSLYGFDLRLDRAFFLIGNRSDQPLDNAMHRVRCIVHVL
jgi:hypothetical protein